MTSRMHHLAAVGAMKVAHLEAAPERARGTDRPGLEWSRDAARVEIIMLGCFGVVLPVRRAYLSGPRRGPDSRAASATNPGPETVLRSTAGAGPS